MNTLVAFLIGLVEIILAVWNYHQGKRIYDLEIKLTVDPKDQPKEN